MMDIYVIVCAYNEAQNVESMLEALQSQTYKGFNLILVDDGSTDSTYQIMEQKTKTLHFTDSFKTFTLIRSEHIGKDENVRRIVDTIKENALILLTDADCLQPDTWVETMYMEHIKTKASMLIGPVKISEEYPFQATEFLSIQTVTRASAMLGNPLICGGANLAFTIDGYRLSKPYMRTDKPNGADMYLLDAMKQTHQSIVAVTNAAAIVVTKGKNTICGFLNQRTRWAGKALNYKSKSITITAILVLLLQIFLIVIPFFAPFHHKILYFWVVKVLMDLDMLSYMAVKMDTTKLIPYILPVSILYPLYVVIVFIKIIVNRLK